MDLINKIDVILEKMKLQIHTKGIYSLSQIFIAIVSFDVQDTGVVNINKFEIFLSTIGIFLKTQELSELLKYVTDSTDFTTIKFEKFIGLFKKEVPRVLNEETIEVFNTLKNNEGKVTVEALMNCCQVDHHFHVAVMHKAPHDALKNVEIAIKFLVGDKQEIELNDFIELNNSMYWLIPKQHEDYFKREMPALWGMTWYGRLK